MALCLSSLIIEEDSLDGMGAGATAGEAARYDGRGDGVVAVEDGVVIL
jgi:hypothetical protein